MRTYAIETEDLTKRYGSHEAVSGIDLTVETGEVYGFLGPNGAGKSTTIAMLLSYVHPTEGTARVFGHDVEEDPVEIKQRVGVLPEGCELYDRLSGRKHLTFAIDAHDADDDPEALIDQVGLTPDAADRPVGGYSTGMRQRLKIALSLIDDPDLLILDEPSSGLDPEGIQMLRETVLEKRDEGIAVFFSSHILEQVEAVCDRIAILVDGELRTSGDVDTLKSDIGPAVVLETEVADVPSGLTATLESMEPVSGWNVRQRNDGGHTVEVHLTDADAKARVLRTFEEHTTIENFTMEEPSLESLFEKHVGEAER